MSLLQEAADLQRAENKAASESREAKKRRHIDRVYEYVMSDKLGAYPYLDLQLDTAEWHDDNVASFVGDDGLVFKVKLAAVKNRETKKIDGYYVSNIDVSKKCGNKDCPHDGYVWADINATYMRSKHLDENGVWDRDDFVRNLKSALYGRPYLKCKECNKDKQRNRCAFCGRG